jgi:hypothetical protein
MGAPASRSNPSFDFAQDGELVEPLVAMMSQAGACSYMGAKAGVFFRKGFL